jgi:hypothetical protein
MNFTTSSFSLLGLFKYFLLAAFLMLAGCAAVQPVVPSTEAPKATVGYVAGVFSAAGANEFGLGISKVSGGEEVVLPFNDSGVPRKGYSFKDRVTMIQLAPGRYRVSSWLTYGRGTKDIITRKALSNGPDGLEFVVTPGRVWYLGKFSADTSFTGFNTVNFRIQPQRIPQRDLALLLEIAYPNFPPKLLDAQSGSVF